MRYIYNPPPPLVIVMVLVPPSRTNPLPLLPMAKAVAQRHGESKSSAKRDTPREATLPSRANKIHPCRKLI